MGSKEGINSNNNTKYPYLVVEAVLPYRVVEGVIPYRVVEEVLPYLVVVAVRPYLQNHTTPHES